ncbi:hypothetical protein [Aeromicrobium sp. 179-A 4D2 NHS]|uniref:hypothetical protein n=1 Tax=Aeromicrobium sp. 179-A 4D2 NHS TaxID=3142375 RepID=UPI0039A1C08C
MTTTGKNGKKVNATKGIQGFHEMTRPVAADKTLDGPLMDYTCEYDADAKTMTFSPFQISTDAPPSDEFDATSAESHAPYTAKEARAVFKNLTFTPDVTQQVYLGSFPTKTGIDRFEVKGPETGPPLEIINHAGFNDIIVTGGRVRIFAYSPFGNPIKARGDAKVYVIAGESTKVSVDVEGDSRVVVESLYTDRARAHTADNGEVEVWHADGTTTFGGRNKADKRPFDPPAQAKRWATDGTFLHERAALARHATVVRHYGD